MKGLIGVLGGMGPAATVDLFNKFVTFTAAQRDQEHIPLIISSIPDIPDRTDALMHHGHSPLPAMRDYMHKLEDAGAECIVIPCNTAHFWFNELKECCHTELLSIVETSSHAAHKSLYWDVLKSPSFLPKQSESLQINILTQPDH